MRNLLAFFAAVTLTFFGLGWYLGWYKMHSTPTQAGQRSITIDINTVKIGEDLERGEKKLHEMIEKAGKDSTPKDKDAKTTDSSISPAKGEFDHPIVPKETTTEKKEGEGKSLFWFDGLRK